MTVPIIAVFLVVFLVFATRDMFSWMKDARPRALLPGFMLYLGDDGVARLWCGRCRGTSFLMGNMDEQLAICGVCGFPHPLHGHDARVLEYIRKSVPNLCLWCMDPTPKAICDACDDHYWDREEKT